MPAVKTKQNRAPPGGAKQGYYTFFAVIAIAIELYHTSQIEVTNIGTTVRVQQQQQQQQEERHGTLERRTTTQQNIWSTLTLATTKVKPKRCHI